MGRVPHDCWEICIEIITSSSVAFYLEGPDFGMRSSSIRHRDSTSRQTVRLRCRLPILHQGLRFLDFVQLSPIMMMTWPIRFPALSSTKARSFFAPLKHSENLKKEQSLMISRALVLAHPQSPLNIVLSLAWLPLFWCPGRLKRLSNFPLSTRQS